MAFDGLHIVVGLAKIAINNNTDSRRAEPSPGRTGSRASVMMYSAENLLLEIESSFSKLSRAKFVIVIITVRKLIDASRRHGERRRKSELVIILPSGKSSERRSDTKLNHFCKRRGEFSLPTRLLILCSRLKATE